MNGRPLERLDSDIAALLRNAEPYPEAPANARARVKDALKLRIANAASSGLSDAAGDHATALSAQQPATGIFSLASKPILMLATTFVVGASVGALLHGAFRPRAERIIYVERPSMSFAPPPAMFGVAAPASALPETPPVAAIAAPAPARSAVAEKSVAPSSSDLAAEQGLLDTARTAFAQGRGQEALGPLDRHAQRYPKGILAEEREALAINVLVTLGRYDDARERSARFLRRYPGSLLRASVEAAIEAIP
jgi:hypothetical protein